MRKVTIAVSLAFALLVAPSITAEAQKSENPAELYNKANALEAAGRYTEAIPYSRRALEIEERRSGPNHLNVALILNQLGDLYLAQGQYADAEGLYERSLMLRQRLLKPSDTRIAIVLNNLAAVYDSQGRYSDAELSYKRSLAIQEKAHGPVHREVAVTLDNLAKLYVHLGRYADAEPLHKRSLAIEEELFGPKHQDVAVTLNNLASLYENQGRFADAKLLYKRSLEITQSVLGPDHVEIAPVLNNLALLYDREGRYTDADPLYKRLFAILEAVYGPNHPYVGKSVNNAAERLRAQGRYGDAEPLYKRSLAIAEKALGPEHPDVAASLGNLALLYNDQRRYTDAEPLFKRALAIWEKALGADYPKVGDSLNNLAMLYHSQGRFGDALPLVRNAAQKGFDRKGLHLAVLTGAIKNVLITRTEALNESFEVVQRTMSSAASTAINQLSMRFAAGNDELAQLVRRDQDLAAQNESLDKLLIAAIAKEPSKRDLLTEQRIRDRLKSISAERAEIGILFNQRFPNFAALSKPTPISVKDTQAVLSDDEALVVLDFGAKSYAWLITRTEADWIELGITAKELSDGVQTLRSSLTFDTDKPFDTQLAFKIYQEIFGTLADKFQGKTRLSVVTNGALTSLPLQLLVTKDPSNKLLKDTDWLVRSYAVTNLPSVASLQTVRSASSVASATKPMIAFADPVFSKDPNSKVLASRSAKSQQPAKQVALRSVVNFYEGGQPDLASLAKALPQLPDTADEVRAIGEVLQASRDDLKLGVFASEATVKQTKLDPYRIVYFATHGLVAGEVEKFAKVKAEPALALTIPEKPTDLDDGLLTASEVAQLKLNADWVVLSACNTAAEEKPGAEALSGLARAFFYAGARSLVVSHWEVDSGATVKLMTKMFQSAANDPKLSHAEALQASMQAMIDNAKSDDDAHPRLWAPFVVVGEPARAK